MWDDFNFSLTKARMFSRKTASSINRSFTKFLDSRFTMLEITSDAESAYLEFDMLAQNYPKIINVVSRKDYRYKRKLGLSDDVILTAFATIRQLAISTGNVDAFGEELKHRRLVARLRFFEDKNGERSKSLLLILMGFENIWEENKPKSFGKNDANISIFDEAVKAIRLHNDIIDRQRATKRLSSDWINIKEVQGMFGIGGLSAAMKYPNEYESMMPYITSQVGVEDIDAIWRAVDNGVDLELFKSLDE